MQTRFKLDNPLWVAATFLICLALKTQGANAESRAPSFVSIYTVSTGERLADVEASTNHRGELVFVNRSMLDSIAFHPSDQNLTVQTAVDRLTSPSIVNTLAPVVAVEQGSQKRLVSPGGRRIAVWNIPLRQSEEESSVVWNLLDIAPMLTQLNLPQRDWTSPVDLLQIEEPFQLGSDASTMTLSASAVPEPSGLPLVAIGALAFLLARRQKS